MSIKESVQDLFKPREVREAERIAKIEDAEMQEEQAAISYLTGQISLEQYHQSLEETRPITQINLRKLASDISDINRRD